MRNKPNPKMTTNSNEGIEYINAELEEQPSNNSGEVEQEEELPVPESEINTNSIEEITADPPSMEPIGIGARLPTQDR